MLVHDRSEAVLKSVGEQVASRAASGRYVRSEPIRSRKVRFWATAKPRSREDHLGVQFFGEGVRDAERYRRALESAGFLRHRPQADVETFAKPIPFAADGGIDVEALNAAKRRLDGILGTDGPNPAVGGSANASKPGRSFREFMLGSPLSEVDLDLPERGDGWRPNAL